MKRLKSCDKTRNRQQIWKHKGRVFSIVNLYLPAHADYLKKIITQEEYDSFMKLYEESMHWYGDYHIEIADITGGNVEVLRRCTSFDEAKEFIRGYDYEVETTS